MNEKNENQVEQGLKKTERGKSMVFGRLALSKYQFETGTEGYRYASYFPPAIMVGFPFLFIFTAARAAIPDQPRFYIYRRSAGQRCTGRGNDRESHGGWEETGAGWEKDGRIVAETFPPDILRHFVSNPKVEGVGASPGIGLIRLLWR